MDSTVLGIEAGSFRVSWDSEENDLAASEVRVNVKDKLYDGFILCLINDGTILELGFWE